jgi:uncharacterized protein YbjT (DUF2867 family)
VDIRSVCLLGGTGFVGQAVADALSPLGVRIRVVTRSEPRAAALRVLPTAEVAVGDVHDGDFLRRAFDNMDAVVNLVGILHESRRQTFRACHAELPRKVASACHAAGVQHLLHMSALAAAADAPSAYLRSKAEGEARVRAESGVTAFTILRPSVIFGEGDAFLNLFATMVRRLPVIPLAAADAKFQPIWVEDVARCFAGALGNPRCFGQAYDLCGPHAFTLRRLVELVGEITGHKRRVVALPGALASLQAWTLEHLPGKLMTRDNLRSMQVANVCKGAFPEVFGFEPSPVEAVIAAYLSPSTSRARYGRFRNLAGR